MECTLQEQEGIETMLFNNFRDYVVYRKGNEINGGYMYRDQPHLQEPHHTMTDIEQNYLNKMTCNLSNMMNACI